MEVALLGKGKWGSNIYNCLLKNKNISKVWVYDKRIPFESSFDSIVNNKNIKAFFIATPPHTHLDYVEWGLRTGRHVFCEKPFLPESSSEKYLKEANNKRLVLDVGFVYTHNEHMKRIKDIINKGELGDIKRIISRRLHMSPIRNDVTPIQGLIVHDLSLLTYWFGRHKFSDPKVFKITDDHYCTKFKINETEVFVEASWDFPEKVRDIVIMGDKGTIRYNETPIPIMNYREFQKGDGDYIYTKTEKEIKLPKINPLQQEIDTFINRILKKQKRNLTDSEINHINNYANLLDK